MASVGKRILSDEDYAECERLTAKAPQRTGDAVRIELATLPQPKSPDEVEAELQRQKEQLDILQVLQPNGKLKTYRMKNEQFRYVPPRLAPTASTAATAAPRRQATTSSRRRASTARRTSQSRDGPGLGNDSDEPPDLEHLRPLTAVARASGDRERRQGRSALLGAPAATLDEEGGSVVNSIAEEQAVESAALTERHLWAATMVALDLDTAGSILRGLRVRAGNLDAVVLRRALRGEPLPDPEDYIEITPAMLEAIDEAGPLPIPTTKGGRR